MSNSFSKQNVASILGISLLLLLNYYATVVWLVGIWTHDKPYSHGFFVPLISIYLIWATKERWGRIPVSPDFFSGSLLILSCALLLVVGRVGAVMQFEVISLFFIFPGIVLFLLGWKHLRSMWLALSYLVFMLPFFDSIFERIHKPFQHLAARIGSSLLAIIYPTYQDGVYIQLPDITLEVASACSGINFLFSVLAIGLPLVYLTQRTWGRALTVLLLGSIITVLANSVRVALAGVMGQCYGADMLHGPGHILRGWFVAQVGWIALFIVNWLVCKRPSDKKYRLYESWREHDEMLAEQPSQLNKGAFRPVGMLMVFFLALALHLHVFSMPRPVILEKELNSLPWKINSWYGRDSSWMKSEEFFPGVDSEIMRTYLNPMGERVNLYIGYFESQLEHKRIISYHSRVLYDNAQVIQTGLGDAFVQQANLSSHIMKASPYRVMFWNRFPDSDIVDWKKAKLKTITNALLHRRNNAAVVILAVPERTGRAEEVLKDFLASIAPEVSKISP